MRWDPGFLSKLVEKMAAAGASYAEARLHSVRGLDIVVMNGMVVSVGRASVEGVALRAVVGGGLGFASSPLSAGREGAEEAAGRAIASARAASLSPDSISMAPARLGRARVEAAERIPIDSVGVEDKITRLVEAYKSLEAPEGLKLQNVVIHYSEAVERKIIVTSDGALIETYTPRVAVFYNITAKGGGRTANRWFQLGGTGGLELLDEFKFEETMRDDVESLAVNLLKASTPPKGVMDVVLSPELSGIIAHEAAGHPSEADRVLGREAAQAGMSFRSWMKEGEIGSEYATVIDDPTIPGSYGFYLYDEEGVPARARKLYDKGRLAELLHNRETAAVYGVESNAAARARDYKSEPIVRMANTYIAPGDYSFDELVEDVEEGVYIKKYMEWNIDDVRWGQRYVGLEAYMIRNGRLAEPVRDVAIELTTKTLFSSIDAAAKDLKFYAGTCGKGEPDQGIPVWMGGPHIRLRRVKVG